MGGRGSAKAAVAMKSAASRRTYTPQDTRAGRFGSAPHDHLRSLRRPGAAGHPRGASMRRQDELIALYQGRSRHAQKYLLSQLGRLALAFDSEELLEFLQGQIAN